jgi:hypothetical protein
MLLLQHLQIEEHHEEMKQQRDDLNNVFHKLLVKIFQSQKEMQIIQLKNEFFEMNDSLFK